jgi:hypothetical protein
MGYSIPRMVKTMQIGNWESVDVNEMYIGRVDVSAFPNPANDVITWKTNNAATMIQDIEMIDIAGRQVFTSQHVNSNAVTIPASELLPGIYMSRITLENGKQVTKKIMIQ